MEYYSITKHDQPEAFVNNMENVPEIMLLNFSSPKNKS